MACQNPLSTYSLLPSPCKSYTSVVHFSSSPLISRCFVFSFIRAFSPPTERRLISSISPLTLKLHFSYPHRPSTAAPTSPRILRKAAEYVFPDPIPEFAEAETSKFRDHLFERLSKKDIFEDSLDEIVRICAEFCHYVICLHAMDALLCSHAMDELLCSFATNNATFESLSSSSSSSQI